jgi:putative membrane protein
MNVNRRCIRISIFAAAIFAGTALAQAQAPGTGAAAPQQPMAGQQPQPQQPTLGGLNGVPTTPAVSPGDQMFVESIFKSDAVEVQLGQLAQQKSQSDDVKQFGPKEPSKKDRQLIAKLESLSGQQFDEEYIKAVVKDNRQDAKDFKSEAESAQDTNLQQAAKTDAPVLAEHLQAAEQIAQAHNVAIDAKK